MKLILNVLDSSDNTLYQYSFEHKSFEEAEKELNDFVENLIKDADDIIKTEREWEKNKPKMKFSWKAAFSSKIADKELRFFNNQCSDWWKNRPKPLFSNRTLFHVTLSEDYCRDIAMEEVYLSVEDIEKLPPLKEISRYFYP